MEENFKDIDQEKEKRSIEFFVEKEEKAKISIDERNRVLNKTRGVMESGKKERLTQEEENVLKEITGVLFIAYKKYIEILDKKEIGGIKDGPEL